MEESAGPAAAAEVVDAATGTAAVGGGADRSGAGVAAADVSVLCTLVPQLVQNIEFGSSGLPQFAHA